MLTSFIPHAATAAALNVQTVAFNLGDSASEGTAQQVFFPEGESLIAYGLIIAGVIFGIGIQVFLHYLMTNNKRFTTYAILLVYSAGIGFVVVSLGVGAAAWIFFGTVGGALLARRVTDRIPGRKAQG